MLRIFYLISLIALLTSCGSSKSLDKSPAGDKALLAAVKKLNKKPGDTDALNTLTTLYADAQKRYLDSVALYEKSNMLNRWNKIVAYYAALQDIHKAISSYATVAKLVPTVNYQSTIDNVKQQAAEENYQKAQASLSLRGMKSDAQKAYRLFKEANNFIPGYKDATAMMGEALKNSTVQVVINTITPNASTSIAGNQIRITSTLEYFQQQLAYELNGKTIADYPAQFYTAKEAKLNNITADWAININITKFFMAEPQQSQSTSTVSNQIQDGYDTSRNPIYITVTSTVTSYMQSLYANMDIAVDMLETATEKIISSIKLKQPYQWSNSYSNSTGDNRALDREDSKTVVGQRSGYSAIPDSEDVLNSMFNKLMPLLKEQIINGLKVQIGN